MSVFFSFDIAAFIISALLIVFYFQKRQIVTLQNSVFLLYLTTLVLTIVMEVCTACYFSSEGLHPVWLSYLVEGVYLSLTKSFGLIFATYCVGLSEVLNDKTYRFRKLLELVVVAPYVVALLIIWLSPVFASSTPLAFTIDAGGALHLNENSFWFVSLYTVGLNYVLFAIVFIACQRKKVETSKRVVLYICAVLVFAAVLFQRFFAEIGGECFALAVAALIFFFHLQRPEEVIDSITKILNQIAFVRVSSRCFLRGTPFSCVSILIDDTVFLSHTFGINQMNNFLREVGEYLCDAFSYESVFCINQNCYTVIIKNPTEESVKERFLQNWFYDSVELKLYIRVCVVECPKCAKSSEEILDVMNLVATDERYNQPVVYANEIDLEYKRRNDYIDYALKKGITQNRFDVYYQPIYSTADKRIIGAEALVRLRDEKGHFISPEDFIPIAEKSGTILRIGEFVYESVCRTLSQVNLSDYGIKKIDINLSVAQCMQEILAEQILAIQSIYRIPAAIINLEITETAAAHSPEILLRNMERLAAAGFELSLDDYGSGYSNMNYMLNLPFKMIKIDKYIVWSAFSDERARKALTATVQMIKSLGMTVLAEGVEDKEQASLLESLGCDYLQGYYYSRPIQKTEFLELMKSQMKGKALQEQLL